MFHVEQVCEVIYKNSMRKCFKKKKKSDDYSYLEI